MKRGTFVVEIKELDGEQGKGQGQQLACHTSQIEELGAQVPHPPPHPP